MKKILTRLTLIIVMIASTTTAVNAQTVVECFTTQSDVPITVEAVRICVDGDNGEGSYEARQKWVARVEKPAHASSFGLSCKGCQIPTETGCDISVSSHISDAPSPTFVSGTNKCYNFPKTDITVDVTCSICVAATSYTTTTTNADGSITIITVTYNDDGSITTTITTITPDGETTTTTTTTSGDGGNGDGGDGSGDGDGTVIGGGGKRNMNSQPEFYNLHVTPVAVRGTGNDRKSQATAQRIWLASMNWHQQLLQEAANRGQCPDGNCDLTIDRQWSDPIPTPEFNTEHGLWIFPEVDFQAGYFYGNKTDAASNLRTTSVALYPNPAGEQATVAFNLDKPATNVTISVTDLSGRVVMSKTLEFQQKGAHTLDLNTSSLPAGVYQTVVLVDGRQAFTRKLSVIH